MNCGLDLQMFDFLADLNSRIQLDQDFVFSIYFQAWLYLSFFYLVKALFS